MSDGLGKMVDALECAFSAEDVDLVDVLFGEFVDDHVSIKLVARGSEEGASFAMDVLDKLRGQLAPVGVDAVEAVEHAVDLRDLVVVLESHNKLSDDDIHAGAEASAGDYGGTHFLGAVEDVLAWSGAEPAFGPSDGLVGAKVSSFLGGR